MKKIAIKFDEHGLTKIETQDGDLLLGVCLPLVDSLICDARDVIILDLDMQKKTWEALGYELHLKDVL